MFAQRKMKKEMCDAAHIQKCYDHLYLHGRTTKEFSFFCFSKFMSHRYFSNKRNNIDRQVNELYTPA